MPDTIVPRRVSRREFTSASINAVFVGMAVTMTGCSGGGSGAAYSPTTPTPTSTPAPTQAGDKPGAVGANHGHVAVITSAQLQAGGAVTLSIEGSAGHNHTVELTADQVGQIAAGTRVTKTSSVVAIREGDGYGYSTEDRHEHSVTFN